MVWAICSYCHGNGVSSAYLGAFTEDETAEGPDFYEDYMEGYYDRACENCDGSGKMRVLPVSLRTPEVNEYEQ